MRPKFAGITKQLEKYLKKEYEVCICDDLIIYCLILFTVSSFWTEIFLRGYLRHCHLLKSGYLI